MQLLTELFQRLSRYQNAETTTEQLAALYSVRQFLTENDLLDIFCAIEVQLHYLAQRVPETYKDGIRELGFQFSEDLDNALELLCEEEDDDELF